MKFRIFLFAALVLLVLSGGCRTDPLPAEETPAPAAPSSSPPSVEIRTAMDWERWYNGEEILRGRVYMTPPPWLAHPVK